MLLTKYTKAVKFSHIGAMLFTALLVFVLAPALRLKNESNNLITIFINGVSVGKINDASLAEDMILQARKRIARESEELVLINYDLMLSGTREIFGSLDSESTIVDNIYQVFNESIQKTKEPVYEVKINEFTVNLRTPEEVLSLLQAAKDPYDEENSFGIDIVRDPTRELNVLTTFVNRLTEDDGDTVSKEQIFPAAGGYAKLDQIFDNAENQDIEHFEFGTQSLDFNENVEIVQAYADPEDISTLEEAIELVTKTSEKEKTYEVAAGDTLSGIAEKNNTSLQDLIAMNAETISSVNSPIMVGDILKVTSPEPELSVLRTDKVYYEENYNAPIEYIDNDEWFTTESVVRREPVEGFRKVVADITYKNNEQQKVDIIYEDDVILAVAKVVERGTKMPPTFIKPISGGRMSSGFGRRKAPKKGASTYHKGIDWATPIGTSVVASSGGTVVRAGWGAGYGYCVYIQHPNGMMTRYGHLKNVLVKSGQTVRQGERIALSGNTGVSTGPHLHFEILVNGSQVNPLNYLQ
ncbi:MAG: M23 family metallopeptidase [Lachnospiraceae bacterium]|nr:M23 family metallopeptidase [Lachnospiraceae bacterium]